MVKCTTFIISLWCLWVVPCDFLFFISETCLLLTVSEHAAIFLDFFLYTVPHKEYPWKYKYNIRKNIHVTPRDWWRNEILKSVIASIDIISHRLHLYKLGKLDTQSISYFISDTPYTLIIFVSLTIMAKNILHLNKYIYSEILYDKKKSYHFMMQFMVYIWFYQIKVNISMRFILCKIKKSIKKVICFIISIYSTCKGNFAFNSFKV